MAGDRLIKVALILTTLVACADAGNEGTTPSPRAQGAGGGAKAGAAPSPDAAAAPEERCVGGWIEPDETSDLFQPPLDVIASTMRVEPTFEVVEMRYFVGPEAPPVDKGYLQDIPRWYVKARHPDGFRGRWLVERRRFGAGVVAVAPWASTGFRSPDWVGFQYDSADRTRRRYPGLPGRWVGIPYDFVVGGAGLDNPGLPPELTGCLAGT